MKHSAELKHFGLDAYTDHGYIQDGRGARVGFKDA